MRCVAMVALVVCLAASSAQAARAVWQGSLCPEDCDEAFPTSTVTLKAKVRTLDGFGRIRLKGKLLCAGPDCPFTRGKVRADAPAGFAQVGFDIRKGRDFACTFLLFGESEPDPSQQLFGDVACYRGGAFESGGGLELRRVQ